MRLPIFYENSKVPVILSFFSPIEIWANSFGFWVWCRGEMSEITKNHEIIHYVQQRELFMIFQWILYGIFYLIGLVRYRSPERAYYENPFEREAYTNEENIQYLHNRKKYAWIYYLRENK